MTQPVLKVFLKDGAKLPAYAHAGDSGLDLCATKDFTLKLMQPQVAMTGVHVEIPDGYEAQVRPKSGLSSKGVFATLGTVDSNFRGEIGVTLTLIRKDDISGCDVYVHGCSEYEFKAGDKIAQLVIAPVARVAVQQVQNVGELSETERGERGWGSSGV
jgi:dUTP pyrophosphatase